MSLRICIYGAGSVGCYLGGRLLAAGATLRFVGRARIGEELARHGLQVTDYLGAAHHLPSAAIDYAQTPSAIAEALGAADIVLVTVKSAATRTAARELHGLLAPQAIVISLQNGIGNAEVLREELPGVTVLAGMVPFNVLARGQGRFHQGSEGAVAIEANGGLQSLQDVFTRAGLPLALHADMRAVLWAKLLLNLNNAINALSGLPLQQELSQRGYRRCLALAQRETLALLAAARIPLAQLTKLPAQRLPLLLSVPDVLFRRFAGRMVAIDPLARSSMWEDFEAGRATEVDYINGEVLRLAASLGRDAPVNARLLALVRAAEQGGRRDWTAAELLAELKAAQRG